MRANRSLEPRPPTRRSADSPSMPCRAPAAASAAERGAERGVVVDAPARAAARARSGSSPTDGGLAQQLLHVEQRRQPGRDALDERVVALLVLLDLLPVRDDRVGRVGLDLAEHVRMAAHELGVDTAARRRRSVNAPASDASTEWIITWKSRSPSSSSSASYAPAGIVAAGRVERELVDRGRDLVRLLEHVAPQRVMGLRRVPRAPARTAQALGQREQPRELAGDRRRRRCRRTPT